MSGLVTVVNPILPGRNAETRQAQYYQDLLGDLHSAAQRELDDHLASLERRRLSGKPSNLSRLHRLVGAKRAELAALDQLLVALSDRFGDHSTRSAG
ncbi:hypothetical protein [Mycobacterium sp. NPDC050853]|uniref:hypothetical protein n=1 Tax=Mycobacteriaceae TaxID=1762 RepID=UPI0015DE0815|nr:hypothetical protein [Mycobacteroides sp. LB1]